MAVIVFLRIEERMGFSPVVSVFALILAVCFKFKPFPTTIAFPHPFYVRRLVAIASVFRIRELSGLELKHPIAILPIFRKRELSGMAPKRLVAISPIARNREVCGLEPKRSIAIWPIPRNRELSDLKLARDRVFLLRLRPRPT